MEGVLFVGGRVSTAWVKCRSLLSGDFLEGDFEGGVGRRGGELFDEELFILMTDVGDTLRSCT